MVGGYREKLIQLWNDWQVSALVLLSLSLQLLLLTTAGFRRRAQPNWWNRKYFWSLYIGSRFITTYTLGILSRASTGDADADIQAFWAALLLFHLGGPDEFTALTLEDNKLWDRRSFELAIQVSTTAYVFSRYFPDRHFRRFILPFALIFSAGLVKYIEQVVALRQATMEALIESILGKPDAGPDYDDTMNRLDGIMRSGALPSLHINSERDRPNSDPEANGHEVRVNSSENEQQVDLKSIRAAYTLYSTFRVLFADGIFSYKDRQKSQNMFLGKGADWAFKVVEMELSFVYDRLYTKASVSRSKRQAVRFASLGLTLAGSVLSSSGILRASQYQQRHRCVTYTLLAGAVLNDVVILAAHTFSIRSLVHSDWLASYSTMLAKRRRWSDRMAQCNLIRFCLQNLPSELQPSPVVLKLLPAGTTSNGGVPHLAALPSLPILLAGELQAPDGLQRLFERQPLEDQVRSPRFWRKYKQTQHIPVSQNLKDFIYEKLEEKKIRLKRWEEERNTKLEREREMMGRGRASTPGAPALLADPSVSAPDASTTTSSQQLDETTMYYRTFIGCRGDQVTKKEGIDRRLKWSLQDKDFDESLLIWHIATDLRFREERSREEASAPTTEESKKHMEIARELSNYLYYIMVVHPLMLSSSTTMAIKRCRDTCAEARRLFLKNHITAVATKGKQSAGGHHAVNESNAHEFLLKVDTPLHASVVKGDKSKSVLWDGCFLASQLRSITGEPCNDQWRVVSEVWVEMLCYAAVHCGGYQHAERLKDGGELITFVCLLMTHLGMGKHYRTEVGDASAHISAYTAT